MVDDALIGQDRVRKILKRLLSSRDRLPHALLLVGPEGSGRTAAAMEIARALHCTRPGADGTCGTCAGCRKTSALNHPDFSVLLPARSQVSEERVHEVSREAVTDPYGWGLPETSAMISVDRIRGLIRSFTYGSFEGADRTAVILHVHQMRPEAANSLLKTLEEPPPRSLIVLTAPTSESVLPTIVSRCQTLKFAPVAPAAIAQVLRARAACDDETARYVAETSGGNVRRALAAAAEGTGDVQDRAYRFLDALVVERESKTYAAIEQLAGQRQDAVDTMRAAEVWLRDVLRYLEIGEASLPDGPRSDQVRRLGELYSLDRIRTFAESLERIRERNTRNVNLHLGVVDLWRRVRNGAPAPLV